MRSAIFRLTDLAAAGLDVMTATRAPAGSEKPSTSAKGLVFSTNIVIMPSAPALVFLRLCAGDFSTISLSPGDKMGSGGNFVNQDNLVRRWHLRTACVRRSRSPIYQCSRSV